MWVFQIKEEIMFVLEHTETFVLFITIRNRNELFRIYHEGMLVLPEAKVRQLETFHDCAYRIKEGYLYDKKSYRLDRFTSTHEPLKHGSVCASSFVYVQDFDDDCVIKKPHMGEWTPYREILDRHEYSELTHEVIMRLIREHRLI